MELDRYVTELHRQLALLADGLGEDASAAAERLLLGLESSLRLTFLDLLSAASAEITRELAPGSVDVRLRGSEPEFVVAPPPVEPAEDPDEPASRSFPALPADARSGDEAALTRINLRLPEPLKARIEQAADREGLSVNAWLVRAATSAVERGQARFEPPPRRSRGGQRYSGWAR